MKDRITAKELLDFLQLLPDNILQREVKVWLPGRLIRLGGVMSVAIDKDFILIEGNVDQ